MNRLCKQQQKQANERCYDLNAMLASINLTTAKQAHHLVSLQPALMS